MAVDTVRFLGNLYPKGILINCNLPDILWRSEDLGQILNFKTRINNSVVNVECSVENYHSTMLSDLHKRAFDLARTAANLVCFAQGEGVSVTFETVILPDGTPTTLRLHDQQLAGLVTSYSLDPARWMDFTAVAMLITSNPAVFACLADLIEVVTFPHVGAINCGRVIDSVRRIIDPNSETKQSWASMRRVLNLSEAYLRLISDTSTGPRHGDRQHIPGETIDEISKRTWVVFDRFLVAKVSGAPLTEPQYPML